MVDEVARRAAPAATILLVVVGALLAPGDDLALRLLAAAVAGATTVVLAWRRASGWPLLVGLLVAVVAAVAVCFGVRGAPNLGWFSLCVLGGWATAAEPLRRAVVVPLVAVAALLANLVVSPDAGWGAWIAGTTVSSLAFAGVRRQQILLDRLREAQAGLADRTRAEERARVAGELHDIVGHALTVSLLHLSSARLAVAEGDPDADASLAEAERLSRRSLEEVRSAVGLMRDQAASPLPGAGDVDELVESFRRAGTAVYLEVDGDLAALGQAEGLTVYRILQEALTNVARHAPTSSAAVRLRVGADGTVVQVDSDGAPARSVTPGHGLVGLRERAEALGGRATAGPHGSGWRVEAVLP